MKHAITLGAAAILLAACSTNQRVDTVRMGDNTLSCDVLYTEILQLDAMRGKASADAGKNTAVMYGTGAALLLAPFTLGASLIALPVLGAAGLAGGLTAGQDQLSAETAHARSQYLTGIFNQKNCVAPK